MFFSSTGLPRVKKLGDKGDVVACDLIAKFFSTYYFSESYSLQEKNEVYSDEKKKEFSLFINFYKHYSSIAVDAGYWPAAFPKCFSNVIVLDGGSRQENIEKYGWMFENVEWAKIHSMLGSNYLSLDWSEQKYYKNAASSFVKAYELQKKDCVCGFISFFLKAGTISESKNTGIDKKDIDILYYKGLGSDDPAMLSGIGKLYFTGVGDNHLGRNESSAFEHFERAYDMYDNEEDSRMKKLYNINKSEIAFILGYMLFNGVGTEKNQERAVHYYEFAVQNGEKRAIEPLADCYRNGIGVKKDLNKYKELIAMSNDK